MTGFRFPTAAERHLDQALCSQPEKALKLIELCRLPPDPRRAFAFHQ